MVDFKIRRGTSGQLLDKRLVLEDGCWYLAVDTAELFLCTHDADTGALALKRINGNTLEELSDEIKAALEELQNRLVTLESVSLYQEIKSEDELPAKLGAPDFNPNVSYYLRRPYDNNKVSVYIYDASISSFVCTNEADETTIRAIVTDSVGAIMMAELDRRVPEAVNAAIDDLFRDTVLHGGDASGEEPIVY